MFLKVRFYRRAAALVGALSFMTKQRPNAFDWDSLRLFSL